MTTSVALMAEIFTQVKAFADANGLRCAYPNKTFDPAGDSIWLELSIFPNDQQFGLADRLFKRGIIQISICSKKDAGDLGIRDVVDAIGAAWPVATVLIDSIRVTSSPADKFAFIRGDQVYVVPVSFAYNE